MRKSLSIATAVLIVSLAGCKQEQAETEKAPQPETSKPVAAPEPTPAQKTEPKTQDTAQDTETITDKACLAAVTKETGESDVSVISNEFSEANTVVMLSVGAQQAPWRCLVSNDGQVAELSFEGDDSAGVDSEPQSSSDVTDVTNNACLAAAKQETGEPDIEITSNEFSEANTLVMLGVGAQRAPWRCLVSNDGQVAELSFEGDDSAGVADQEQSGSDVSAAAIDACLGAVSGQTGESNVSVLSSEFSEANSQVMVGVGNQNAPWRCLVSNDGAVQEVTSQVDEGNL